MPRLVLVLAALLLPGVTTLAADKEVELPVSEVAPGIFVHAGANALMTADNDGAIANVGFVIGSEAVAVIDTGGSVREGDALLAAIRARTDKPIRYVINTHGHPDHVFGNAAFRRSDTEFVGHVGLRKAMEERGPYYIDNFRRIMGRELIDPVAMIPPTIVVSNELRLNLGSRSLTLQAWPTAHSDSDLTVLDDTTGTLFAGDLVFLDHIPVMDGSIRGWLAAIKALETMPATRVVPGHGPVREWPAALADERRYLETLLADVRALNAKGVSIGSAAGQAGTDERARWLLFDEYNARNATAAFSQIEWE
jgi:quinoprotein relay system zinc metallohydrolase 2